MALIPDPPEPPPSPELVAQAGITMGVVGTLTPLVDLWLDEKRLPHWMKAVSKAG